MEPAAQRPAERLHVLGAGLVLQIQIVAILWLTTAFSLSR